MTLPPGRFTNRGSASPRRLNTSPSYRFAKVRSLSVCCRGIEPRGSVLNQPFSIILPRGSLFWILQCLPKIGSIDPRISYLNTVIKFSLFFHQITSKELSLIIIHFSIINYSPSLQKKKKKHFF